MHGAKGGVRGIFLFFFFFFFFFFPSKKQYRMMRASRSGGQSKRLSTVSTLTLTMTVPVLTFLWCPDGNARMPYVSLRKGHAVEIAFSSFTALC